MNPHYDQYSAKVQNLSRSVICERSGFSMFYLTWKYLIYFLNAFHPCAVILCVFPPFVMIFAPFSASAI